MKRIFTLVIAVFLTLTSNFTRAQNYQWVWMKGSQFPNKATHVDSIHGTNINNTPGGRGGCPTWTDKQGNFWIFGGSSVDPFIYGRSDLWKYDPKINKWIMISGDTTSGFQGHYGQKGVPDSANRPAGTHVSTTTWTDLDGNLWLFGSGFLRNDMWKFDISTGLWTWMRGDTIDTRQGTYGAQGVESVSNDPPGRIYTNCTWLDSVGNLWMFGGMAPSGFANDVWRYNITNNEWTWMNGSNFQNSSGNYGTVGVEDPLNQPPPRMGMASWKDLDNNIWMFGGNDDQYFGGGNLRDMWKFNQKTNMWTWMAGDNIFFNNASNQGHYGTACYYDSINTPSAKFISSSGWVDPCGNFWLFGGLDTLVIYDTVQGKNVYYDFYYSDLWKFNPNTLEWKFIKGDTLTNQAGIYGAQGVPDINNKPVSRCAASAWQNEKGIWLFGGFTGINEYLNDVWNLIPKPFAQISCDSTVADPPFNAHFNALNSSCDDISSYFWDFGDGSTSTLQNPTHAYTTTATLNAKLVVTNCWGIKDSTTEVIYSGTWGVNDIDAKVDCNIYPNPNNGLVNIELNTFSPQNILINISDSKGQIVYGLKLANIKGRYSTAVDLQQMSKGVYILQLTSERSHLIKKFIIQ